MHQTTALSRIDKYANPQICSNVYLRDGDNYA